MATRARAMMMIMMAGLILGCGPLEMRLPTPIGTQVTTVQPAGFHVTLEDQDKGMVEVLPAGSMVRILGHGLGRGPGGQDLYQVVVESVNGDPLSKEAFDALDGSQGWIGAPAVDGQ